MKYRTESWPVSKLLEESESGRLEVNRDYQRGRAWTRPQQQQFIDSILRGYPVPAIFLHEGDEMYYIIDGQQRINALQEYISGDYRLLSAKQAEKRFPSLVYGKHDDIQWLGKTFSELPDSLRNKLTQKEMSVIILKCDNNEVRDLFIRLQEGSVLNDQERRDAWPGDFTEYIFKVGGRDGMEDEYGKEYKPHPFFAQVMHIKSPGEPKGDRGKVRKIAAQLYQMHSSYTHDRRVKGVGKTELNRLYMKNVKFDDSDPRGTTQAGFVKSLRTLRQIFDTTAKRNQGAQLIHGAIHLMLLITTLLEHIGEGDCVAIGRHLKDAHKDFYTKCDQANRKPDDEKDQDEYWTKYRALTSQQADSPRTIKRRHAFFIEKMAEKLSSPGDIDVGPRPSPRAPEILQRVCDILRQEARDLRADLDNSREYEDNDDDE